MNIINALKKLCVITESGARITLTPDFPAFEGHFPSAPLLPAVVQVQIALYASAQKFNKKTKLICVKKAKFIAPALPGDTIDFCLTKKENYLDVTVSKHGAVLSIFQLITEE